MKKLLSMLLVLMLAVGSVGALAEEAVENTADVLVVGTPEMNGDFIYDFTNNAYDAYVKDITSGEYFYATTTYTSANEFIINHVVVEDHTVELDDAGNKTYTFKLHEDLQWNDGSPLAAKDYVFGVLARASREWLSQGTTSEQGSSLVGYAEYHTPIGSAEDAGLTEDQLTDKLAGVKLIDEYTFSVTIAAEKLPYFFEYVYASIVPVCSAVWAPGSEIESDDEGSKITGVDLQACLEAVAGGERYAPTVTCGPYKFVSFENSTATLEVNEYFKGDLDGDKPQFKNVVVKYINQDTDVDQVIAGEVDLVNGVIEGDKIEAARAADTADLTSYKRYGYGMIAFHCDFGPTADQNVRWGLASLIDRTEVLDYVLGGYGATVDGPYGLAMWQYEERQDELEEALIPISFNIEQANAYFDETEWKFEADGTTPFDASKATEDGAYLRHNAEGTPLVIEHMGSENNDVTRAVQSQFNKNAPLAGVTFNVTEADFATLLDNYYYGFQKGDDRFYNSFNLANTFSAAYDPYEGSDHSDYIGTQKNQCQISDEELDATIMAMRSLDPTQTEEHADAFVDYVVRWNELLPSIPLYSNEYFDVFSTSITGVMTTPFVSWSHMVCKLAPAT